MVPDAEIATYTQNGLVPPIDGSLVKSRGQFNNLFGAGWA